MLCYASQAIIQCNNTSVDITSFRSFQQHHPNSDVHITITTHSLTTKDTRSTYQQPRNNNVNHGQFRSLFKLMFFVLQTALQVQWLPVCARDDLRHQDMSNIPTTYYPTSHGNIGSWIRHITCNPLFSFLTQMQRIQKT